MGGWWTVAMAGLLLAGCGLSPAATPAKTGAALVATSTPAANQMPPGSRPTATALSSPAPATGSTTPVHPAAPVARGLFVEILQPAETMASVPASAARALVAGRSQPGAVVSVNGELVEVDRTGAFQTEVPLDDEITAVEVVASDASGAEVRVQRVIVKE